MTLAIWLLKIKPTEMYTYMTHQTKEKQPVTVWGLFFVHATWSKKTTTTYLNAYWTPWPNLLGWLQLFYFRTWPQINSHLSTEQPSYSRSPHLHTLATLTLRSTLERLWNQPRTRQEHPSIMEKEMKRGKKKDLVIPLSTHQGQEAPERERKRWEMEEVRSVAQIKSTVSDKRVQAAEVMNCDLVWCMTSVLAKHYCVCMCVYVCTHAGELCGLLDSPSCFLQFLETEHLFLHFNQHDAGSGSRRCVSCL